MKSSLKRFSARVALAGLCVFLLLGKKSAVQAQEGAFSLPDLKPSVSADGLTLFDAVKPLVIVVDPNPEMQGIKAQGPTAADALTAPEAALSTFSITYVANGGSDLWGQPCFDFPVAAQTAFNAAAAIWANTIASSVPITIKACWATLSSPYILGYSGGQPLRRDFSGTPAPIPGTWYEGSLANALAGRDLDPTYFDMNITYNSAFTWYFGTDSNTPPGTYDLVSVAAHEIAHGLNFSGSASATPSTPPYTGSWGWGGYPYVYDLFMESDGGTKLTSYPTPSTALGTLLTTHTLWFNGTHANAANGGRVKIYAPYSWAPGSSYSHLDYNTFRGTINSLMVYAIASGAANHYPGPVAVGMLKDMGWVTTTAGPPPGAFSKLSPFFSSELQPVNPTLSWQASSGATGYEYCYDTTDDNACDGSWTSTGMSTSASLGILAEMTTYYWQVRATNSTGTTFADSGGWWFFTTAITLAGAVDQPVLAFATAGNAVWFGQEITSHDGVDAAQSGEIHDSQASSLEMTRTFNAGAVAFWWKVSSEAGHDYLRFSIDGILQDQISGEVDWQHRSYPVTAGSHTLTWVYSKDASDLSATGDDTAWVDEFTLPKVDILWQDSAAGWLYLWDMAGPIQIGGWYLTPNQIAPAWKMVGIADFDLDGKKDILWQESISGWLYIWYMDGLRQIGGNYLTPSQIAPAWRIAGIADFDRDGRPDILWQESTAGWLYLWYMGGTKGATRLSGNYLTPNQIAPAWKIAGVADFDRDGQPDLLWQDSTAGWLYVWYMGGTKGASRLSGKYLTPNQVTTNWKIGAVGDFNSDGRSDLLWQDTAGHLYLWYLGGATGEQQLSGAWLTPNQIAPSWRIVGAGLTQ